MAIYRFRKEELEGALNRNALWAIVYGDMMSYLMILFLLMFVWGLAEEVKPEEKKEIENQYAQIIKILGGEVPPELEEQAQERKLNNVFIRQIKKEVEEGEFGEDAKLVVTEERIALTLGEGVLFDLGKADLKPKAAVVLEKLSARIKKRKNQIRVEGHTDTVPIRRGPYKSNFELSMARAYAVMRQLMKLGIDPSRISGLGYGEHRPIESNKTVQGRARNRRVEISFLREE